MGVSYIQNIFKLFFVSSNQLSAYFAACWLFQGFILAYKEEDEEVYENLPPPLPNSQPPSYLPPPPPELLVDSLTFDLDRTDLDQSGAGGQPQTKLSGHHQPISGSGPAFFTVSGSAL